MYKIPTYYNDYNFGILLKEAREEAGYTQAELAAEMGLTQKIISRWECGNVYPHILTLKKLCEVLNTSADVLLRIDFRG